MTPTPTLKLGTCPPWCERPAGHDWEDEWRDGPMREHLRTIDRLDRSNAIVVREYEIATTTGTTRQREIHVDLDSGRGWDARDAQRLAAALNRAARITTAVCSCTTTHTGDIACRHHDCPIHGDEHHTVQ